MREIRTSGSMSGRWKRSKVWLLRHRQPKGSETARPELTHRATSRLYVRRGKVCIFSGCESRPVTVVPAGSNWSDEGGNELVEAFDATGRFWRLSEQAGRNMSERRAGLERPRCGSRPVSISGKAAVVGRRWVERHRPHDSAGVLATACLQTKMVRNTGSPSGAGV
jgi:hypothetical protein